MPAAGARRNLPWASLQGVHDFNPSNLPFVGYRIVENPLISLMIRYSPSHPVPSRIWIMGNPNAKPKETWVHTHFYP